MKITRTWASMNLDQLKQNYDVLKACTDEGMEILRLASANAYDFTPMVGGPMQGVCPQYLAVNTVEDGCALRSRGVTLPILVLQYPDPDNVAGYVKTLHKNFLAQSVDSPAVCRAIANRTIPAYGGTICIHLKVQIGDGTTGYRYKAGDALDELIAARSNLGVYSEGIYTELKAADTEEKKMADIRTLNELADRLEAAAKKPFALRHVFCK